MSMWPWRYIPRSAIEALVYFGRYSVSCQRRWIWHHNGVTRWIGNHVYRHEREEETRILEWRMKTTTTTTTRSCRECHCLPLCGFDSTVVPENYCRRHCFCCINEVLVVPTTLSPWSMRLGESARIFTEIRVGIRNRTTQKKPNPNLSLSPSKKARRRQTGGDEDDDEDDATK